MPPAERPPLLVAAAGCAALVLAMGIGRFAYTPILPSMIEAGALRIEEAGLVAAANFAGYLAGALGAAFVPSGRRRLVFGLAVLASVGTTAAAAWTAGPLDLAAVRFASGLASAAAFVMVASLVTEALGGAHTEKQFALVYSGVGVGIVLSSALGLALSGADWRTAWLAMGALAALAAIPALVGLGPRGEGGRAAPPAKAEGGAGSWPVFVAHAAAYGLSGLGYIVHATFLPVMVAGAPGIERFATLSWLVVGLFAAPSTLVWAAAARRLGPRDALAAALALQAVAVAATAVHLNAFTAFAAGAGLGATFMGVTALGLARAPGLSPLPRTATLAIMTVAFSVGQAVGPLVASRLAAASGDFGPAAGLAAAVLALAFGLVRLQPR
jgi:predicted MFS family arabinose efflux permease